MCKRRIYYYRKTQGLCTECGKPTDIKWNGSHFAKCADCRDRDAIRYYRQRDRSKQTICWDCKNAVPDPRKGIGCSWSRRLKPVTGWTATETELKLYDDITIKSYIVHKCPHYIEEVKDVDEIPEDEVQEREGED